MSRLNDYDETTVQTRIGVVRQRAEHDLEVVVQLCQHGVEIAQGPHLTRAGRQAMTALAGVTTVIAAAALVPLVGGTPALAGTFVYVSNAEDGDIGTYGMPTERMSRREAQA